MKFKELPPYDLLREMFHYDPDTGVVIRKTQSRTAKAGSAVGWLSSRGYLSVTIGRNNFFQLHRLIWKWMTGDDPAFEIDHFDTNRANNRWDNLRLATSSQNSANRGAQSNNTHGHKGIYRVSGSADKWSACIVKDGVRYYLGTFDSAAAAKGAYDAKAAELHGEFARAA